MISRLNEIFIVLISGLIFLFKFLFCSILERKCPLRERKYEKSFKRDIIVLISFPILFISTSLLVNIGKEMSLPGFRSVYTFSSRPARSIHCCSINFCWYSDATFSSFKYT